MSSQYLANQLALLLGAHVQRRRMTLGMTQDTLDAEVKAWAKKNGELFASPGQSHVSEFENGQREAFLQWHASSGAKKKTRTEKDENGVEVEVVDGNQSFTTVLKYLDSRTVDLGTAWTGPQSAHLMVMVNQFSSLIKRAKKIKADDSDELPPELIALYLTAHLAWGFPTPVGSPKPGTLKRTEAGGGKALGHAVKLLQTAAQTDPSKIETGVGNHDGGNGLGALIIVNARAFADLSDAPAEIRLDWYNATTAALARGWRIVHVIRRRKQGAILKEIEQAELIANLFTDLSTDGSFEFVGDIPDQATDLVAVNGVGVLQMFPSLARIRRQNENVTRSSRVNNFGEIRSDLRDDLTHYLPWAGRKPKAGTPVAADQAVAEGLITRAAAWTNQQNTHPLITHHELPAVGATPTAEFIGLDHQMAVAEMSTSVSRYTVKSGGPLMSTLPTEVSKRYFETWREGKGEEAQSRISQLESFRDMRFEAMERSCQAGTVYRDIFTLDSIKNYLSEDYEADTTHPYGAATLSLEDRHTHIKYLASLLNKKGYGYDMRLAEEATLPPGMAGTWMIACFDPDDVDRGEVFFVADVLDGKTTEFSGRKRLARMERTGLMRNDAVSFFTGLHDSLWDGITSSKKATFEQLAKLTSGLKWDAVSS